MRELTAEQTALVSLGRALQRAGYAFTTVTPETHRRVVARAARLGRARARSLRDVFGWNLSFEPDLLPADILVHLQDANAVEPAGTALRSRVRFASLGRALFVHSAFPTEAEDAVFFGPDTYRFASLLRRWAPAARRIVDIGCGSGAGGLVLADRHPERLVLTDINPRALDLACVNATLAGTQPELVQSDLLRAVSGTFDLIVANPPYMRDPAARTYRHGGGEYGEAISVRIVREALPRLADGGVLILYTGTAIVNGIDTFAANLQPLLGAYGRASQVRYEELDPDVFGEELDSPDYADAERIAAVGVFVCVSSAV